MRPESIEMIRYLSNASVLLPLFFYGLKFKHLPKENHIVGIVVLVSAISDLIGFLFAQAAASTSILFNIYYFAVFAVLGWYYYEVVFQFKNRGYLYFGIGAYLVALWFVNMYHDIFTFQGEMWAVTGSILVIFGIVYNNYQVEKPPLLDRNLYSGLIFNAAIMLYFSFNFFLFIIANHVLTELSPDTARMAWGFHNVNNIIKNIAFAFGFYYTNRRRLNLTDEEIERIQWRHLQ